MNHSGMHHGDMDMGGMDMAPGGIPLAGGADDRDGLEMDELTVQLGPVLPYWPPGVVLHCTLNGDVLTRAEVRVLDAAAPAAVNTGTREAAARRCDDVAALLALAGASDLAADARRLRNALLADDSARNASDLDRLERRIHRAPLLRWSLGRVRVVRDPALADGLSVGPGESVFDRLLAMVSTIRDMLNDSVNGKRDVAQLVAAVPGLVTGLDLAVARLVVASLGIPSAAAAARVTDG